MKLAKLSTLVNIPIIASGGAGICSIVDSFTEGKQMQLSGKRFSF
jgi:imidazole glycerol phosphate synthase subunit HisF